VEVYRPGHSKKKATIEEVDFSFFIQECSATIARCMGSRLELSVADAWKVGQPRDADSLVACGEISLRFPRETTAEKFRAIREALAEDPGFVLPAWDLDGDRPASQAIFLKSLRKDPYNAQLCFETFCSVWKSQGSQPEAMQFCRKAIELSPGHGKAHMCVPHAADRRADMIRHSELGYRLLPGNTFAVNNYTQYLRSNGAPNEKLVDLAKEGIEMDPCDPGNYYQAIDLCCNLRAYDEALELGNQLMELFEPEINERTLYCLKQNPERARMIEAGEYDPAAEARRMLAELRKLARRR
jgi:tetratricopeptide (TPR) repeat protein